MSDPRRPHWQLPDGIDRALWDYISSPAIADEYDDFVASSNLIEADIAFLQQHFVVPGRLADLGCGTGRLFAPFSARGFPVVGIDLSANMLLQARAKLKPGNGTVDLLCANLCDLRGLRDHSFAYAACLFSTLGMIVGPAQRRAFLQQVRRILQPDGLFGLHVHNRWFSLFDPAGRRWWCQDLWRQLRRAPDAGDCVMPVYRGIPQLRLHLYTASSIRRELASAGFVVTAMLPLCAERMQGLTAPWLLPSVRANGWLIMARRQP